MKDTFAAKLEAEVELAVATAAYNEAGKLVEDAKRKLTRAQLQYKWAQDELKAAKGRMEAAENVVSSQG